MRRSSHTFDPFGGARDRPYPRPRRTADGLQARSRRGDFARTWWGHRWIEALERRGWAERLARGRTYARAGQVLGLRVAPGRVEARVQGSRAAAYRVWIAVRPIPEARWTRILGRLGARAEVAAALLSGELPESVEATFQSAGTSLLPAPEQDLEADCSCPDWANPCKHIAAVHYLLAESMDRDPFVLLALRGRPRAAVLAALRPRRAGRPPRAERGRPAARTDGPGEAPRPAAPRPSFWGDDSFLRHLTIPPVQPSTVPDAVLRRLGEPAFLRGTPEVLEFLRSSYERIEARARTEVFERHDVLEGAPAEEPREPEEPDPGAPPSGPPPRARPNEGRAL